jgi:hypothetical protein
LSEKANEKSNSNAHCQLSGSPTDIPEAGKSITVQSHESVSVQRQALLTSQWNNFREDLEDYGYAHLKDIGHL